MTKEVLECLLRDIECILNENGKELFYEFLYNKNKEIADLQSELEQANERLKGLPKFKNGDFVWAIFTDDGIYKCQIDAFDYFTNTYLVFPNEDIGNEWIVASYIFKTKKEAEKKLKEEFGH